MQNMALSQKPKRQLSSAAPDKSNAVLVTDPYQTEKSALADLCGISNTELAGAFVNQALATFSRYDPDKKNIALAVAALREIAPKDTFEGMLAAQMLGTHNLAMACLGRAASADHADTMTRNIELGTKLTRTFTAQLEALNRHRGKGQQKVTVEHVTVNAGGQAIVGSVQGLAPRAMGRGTSDER